MKINNKTAYIAGGATILAALVASVVPLVFSIDNNEPNANIENGNNNTIIQGAQDVTIDQTVNNDLDAIRGFEAASLKESILSGCQTLNGYFADGTYFNVDSVDTLIGSIWVQKEKFVSYFGAENQRIAMEYVNDIQPRYLEYIVGLEYFRQNRAIMEAQMERRNLDRPPSEEGRRIQKEGYEKMDAQYQQSMDEARPHLVSLTSDLCSHVSTMERG